MNPNIANMRAARAYAKQDYDKEVVAAAGPSGGAFDSAGPPTWDRASWEGFRAKYGEYPFKASGPMPQTLAGAPAWVYELMGLRVPPVGVTMGSGSIMGS